MGDYGRGNVMSPRTPPRALGVPYTPNDWNADQLAMHRAVTLEAAFHNASCLDGGWYRRPVTIDYQVTPENDERYMLRPADIAPLAGWTPTYTVSRAEGSS